MTENNGEIANTADLAVLKEMAEDIRLMAERAMAARVKLVVLLGTETTTVVNDVDHVAFLMAYLQHIYNNAQVPEIKAMAQGIARAMISMLGEDALREAELALVRWHGIQMDEEPASTLLKPGDPGFDRVVRGMKDGRA